MEQNSLNNLMFTKEYYCSLHKILVYILYSKQYLDGHSTLYCTLLSV
jgi:hypothetical protein